MDWAKITVRWDEKHLIFRIWCALYQRFDSIRLVEWAPALDAVSQFFISTALWNIICQFQELIQARISHCYVAIWSGDRSPHWPCPINFRSTSWEIALRSMPRNIVNDKSTLVQVMAWCRQATSHYLNQCWPRSMWPHGITRPLQVLILGIWS